MLAKAGVAVPRGGIVRSPDEAEELARETGARVVLKAQAWVTGRAALGGVLFADSPAQAREFASRLLELRLGHFDVTEVLIEQALDIRHELFVSVAIDDEARAPMLLLETHGGSGIEDRAESVVRLPVSVEQGVNAGAVRAALVDSPIDSQRHDDLVAAIESIVDLARRYEARSLEVNPLVITADGAVVAVDCRMTIDDYAVFRHPELEIEIARELDHPATALERIAYGVEQADHRGTFFFVQLPAASAAASQGLVGFHGAGGGGSMMSMDAISSLGFTLANFCDTSGNPSAAKVYRAARIILAQPGLLGYFGSGSGVASQEQYHSAYGLAKAFIELRLSIPAVIRLGGNGEERAIEVLQDACRELPGHVEGYGKNDTPAFIAERFAELVDSADHTIWTPRKPVVPDFVRPLAQDSRLKTQDSSYHFPISGGTVWIDHDHCDPQTTRFVIEHGNGLLAEKDGLPVLAVSEADVASRDSDLVALEVECHLANKPVVFVDLPIRGLDDDEVP